MRRQDIQLRLLAKQGDADARLKLGTAYLAGAAGFVRNVPVGLSYLRAALPQARQAVAACVVQHLQLQEILEFEQIDMLQAAAETSDAARLKLAAWRLVCGDRVQAEALLARCEGLSLDLLAHGQASPSARTAQALQALCALQPMNLADVVVRCAGAALAAGRLARTVEVLAVLGEPYEALPLPVLQLVVGAVRHAEQHGLPLTGLPIGLVETALDRAATAGDAYACHTLGRALAGIRCGDLPAERLATAPQLRKAAALLLRAADGGVPAAWLHLYRICADYRGSVANPMMARFCLEKAVQHGIPEAERRLGALALREATDIGAMEQAVASLFRAARQGDAIARLMLQSLVLPVGGCAAQAEAGVQEVQRASPVLAMRLQLARHFGLTKREALSVNPVQGRRSWGLVVEKNPLVMKMRLAEPRAVPAVSDAALDCLERSVHLFGAQDGEHAAAQASLRARALQQRRLFERLQLDEGIFFASATSQQRDALRIGTKWAQRQRHTLQMALAD